MHNHADGSSCSPGLAIHQDDELLALRKAVGQARRDEALRAHKGRMRKAEPAMIIAADRWLKLVARRVGESAAGGGPDFDGTAAGFADALVDWNALRAEAITLFGPAVAAAYDLAAWDAAGVMAVYKSAGRIHIGKDDQGGLPFPPDPPAGSPPGPRGPGIAFGPGGQPYAPFVGEQTRGASTWALEHTGKLVVEITEQTRQGIIRTIEPGILAGTASERLARELRGKVGLYGRQVEAVENYRLALEEAGLDADVISDRVARYAKRQLAYRTMNIARTETSWALNEASRQVYRRYGATQYEWVADPECCDLCRQRAGKIYPIGDAESRPPAKERAPIDPPPLHPSCILPGNSVAPLGRVLAGFRAHYDGPAVRIKTAGGRDITVTSHHNLLTPRGFRFASTLRQGEDLLDCSPLQGIIPIDPNDDRQPAPIEEVVKALSISNGMAAQTMPSSPEQFHGDGVFLDGEVDIIGTDRLLMADAEAGLGKPPGEEKLTPGNPDLAGLPGRGDLDPMFRALALAADGGMGRKDKPLPGLGIGNPSPHEGAGLGMPADMNPGLEKPATDRGPADPERMGKALLRLSGQVTTDKIVSIEIFSYHGFVYDVQTSTTLCAISGLLSSNCECTMVIAAMDPTQAGYQVQTPTLPAIQPAPSPIGNIPARMADPAWTKAITFQETKALEGWVGTDYDYIRAYQRGEPIGIISRVARKKIATYGDILEGMASRYNTAGAWENPLYRGITELDNATIARFEKIKPGSTLDIDKAMSSWSKNRGVAEEFSEAGEGHSILFELQGGRKATAEMDLSSFAPTRKTISEQEVLMRDTRFTVTGIEKEQMTKTRIRLIVKLVEAGIGKAMTMGDLALALARAWDWKQERRKNERKKAPGRREAATKIDLHRETRAIRLMKRAQPKRRTR